MALMLSRSSGYLAALAYPHRAYVRVDVHAGDGTLLAEDVPFSSGSVNATLTSRVARRLSLNLTEDDYPVTDGDLWNPYGNEVRAYRGIEYGDGLVEAWQVFRGRITDVALDPDGGVEVLCLDRAADIVSAAFEGPHVALAGRVVDEYQRLVVEVLPDADFDLDAFQVIYETTPALIFESDRAGACDDLAATAGAFWYPIADGTFTMVRVPWTQGDLPSLYTLADGDGGMVSAAQLSRTRESVWNSVTVYTERLDGSDPEFWTARDDDETSPTFVGGTFGLRARQVSVQTPTSGAQTRTTAETMLRRAKALRETASLQIVPDASIELGDVFTAQVRGRTLTQVVAGFSLPLQATGEMTLDCRSLIGEVQF